MSDTRQAHPEYAADVDEMILDYLIYQTTSSFLKAFRKKEIENDRHHADGYAIHLNLLDCEADSFPRNSSYTYSWF